LSGHRKILRTLVEKGSPALTAVVPYPDKATRFSCKGQWITTNTITTNTVTTNTSHKQMRSSALNWALRSDWDDGRECSSQPSKRPGGETGSTWHCGDCGEAGTRWSACCMKKGGSVLRKCAPWFVSSWSFCPFRCMCTICLQLV